MERTKYWNNTKPSETQLDNTENSKINHMLYRFRSGCQFGIKSGFRVTVNGGDNTKIDVGSGTGYTGGFYPANNYAGSPNSGEHISTDSTSASGTPGYTPAATGVALADYTNGVRNYVSLVYSEVDSTPLPERFYPGTLRNTIYTEAFSAEVVTEATWQAYAADEIEQRVLVGIVTAKGAGVALSFTDIEQFIQPKTHPSCANPTTITGVTIDQLAAITLVGTATLRYEQATKKLYWTAPGDAEGTGTTISSNGSFTLYSSTTTYYVVVAVIFGSLPAVNVTENLEVTALYGRNIPMFSAIDQAHRDMVGTGVVTTTNPHGISIDDIGGGTTDHADLFHVNGIGINANTTELACSNLGTVIHITNLGGFENSFLIDGYIYETVLGFGAGTDATLEMSVVPANDDGDYLVYLDGTSAPHYVLAAECVAGGADPLSPLTNITIMDLSNTVAGNCTLAWDAATKKLTYTAAGDIAGTAVCIGTQTMSPGTTTFGYYKIYSNDTTNWIIVNITGDLGVTNTATFSSDMTTTHYNDLILKLGMINWDGAAVISNIRDIRQWLTSDVRDVLYEEHDTTGNHTKPLRNTLRIARTSLGLYSSVSAALAIGGSADRTGVYGKVDDSLGVIGLASSFYGVWGQAENIGVYGLASSSVGVYGIAAETGVEGIAETYGVRGIASINGVGEGSTGVYGSAEGVIGIYGTASATAIYGGVNNNIGIQAYAGVATALHAEAVNYGVAATVSSNYAVYGSATKTYGVYGIASICGVYGEAGATGVYGVGIYSGVVGIATSNTGVYGLASETYGVYAKANSAIGLYASAPVRGISCVAATSFGIYATASDTAGYFICSSSASHVALMCSNDHTDGFNLVVAGGAKIYYAKGAEAVGGKATQGVIPIVLAGYGTYYIPVMS